MELPNKTVNKNRRFKGQKFVHHKAEEAQWEKFRVPGFISRDTGIAQNTQNVAGVHIIRPEKNKSPETYHDSDILFNFVMEGTMVLSGEGKEPFKLSPGDAFVIPPKMRTQYIDFSKDLELLEVSLPGKFKTYY